MNMNSADVVLAPAVMVPCPDCNSQKGLVVTIITHRSHHKHLYQHEGNGAMVAANDRYNEEWSDPATVHCRDCYAQLGLLTKIRETIELWVKRKAVE